MKIPTISIVTPNFNHAAYLTRCVESVAAQSCSIFEHVIVDDGSTDDSRSILEQLQLRFDRLRVIYLDKNVGAALAVRQAMEEAKGDFVLPLAADDALPGTSIEKFMKVMRHHPDAAYICGEVEYMRGDKIWRRRYIAADEPIYLSPDQLAAYQRSMLTVVNGAAVVRRDLALDSALCKPSLKWLTDNLAYTVISYRHGVWYIPEIVHRFTLTGSNLSMGAQIWKKQKPVLDSLFDLLDSPGYSDVFHFYRRSAALAEVPLILRYMLVRPRTWRFLTFRLTINAIIFFSYRKIRNVFPQRWIDAYIDTRTRFHRSAKNLTT